ncbi:6-phosphogluconate dehydrogenase [Croceivirga thetidis]|uniref:6-phosphogluconate dehydrogenase n=1 Tax=Croceivirga thetidis TaxID=2721623 RepID=A0ABX1GRR4_9FLAO|nr:6-phosphogluconate dehydrogenase [Croceivirga thetidis]NKI32633.1 6-phosphogluconate dehydrogenase [Croceivirga thetidis]
MKKIFLLIFAFFVLGLAGYFAFIYYVPFSEGYRSGELIKFSNKGVLVKTWEGEISQGISGAQIFTFSVEDGEQEVIKKLIELQGKYVKLTYKERYATFFWLGDTKYFIQEVVEEESPHFGN